MTIVLKSIRKSMPTPILRYINATVWLRSLQFICSDISSRAGRKRGGCALMDAVTVSTEEAHENLFAPSSTQGSVSRYQLWVRECAPSFHTSASGALILDFCCSQVTKFMALLYDSLNRLKKLARKAERIYAKALSGYCATLVENVWPT